MLNLAEEPSDHITATEAPQKLSSSPVLNSNSTEPSNAEPRPVKHLEMAFVNILNSRSDCFKRM